MSKGRAGPLFECTSTILLGFAFSDHAPVRAVMQMGPSMRRPSCYRMNSSHFHNRVFKEQITNMWLEGVQLGMDRGWNPYQTMKHCIAAARRIDCYWGKRQAKERRLRLENLQHHLRTAQLALERAPEDVDLLPKVAEARKNLTAFGATQAKWVDFVIQAPLDC